MTLYGLPLLNIKTFLTDPKLGYDDCRKAYLADLEADQRRIIDEQIRAIETRRAAETAEAARLAGSRGTATPPPSAPPESVPFAPNREFDLGKYPACATFFQKGQEAITNEVNGKIFATLGWQVAAYAYRLISDLTREKVEFVWFVDQETGRGVAKNNEFSPGTADRYYYQKTIGELFEGLSGATGTKVVQSVRAGNIYRDVWLTREELRDTITGFVHVAMVPVLGPDGNTVGLLAVGVRLENMARIARAARAKMMLVRKVAKGGQETVEIIGDGNDDEKVEALPDGFRKALLSSRDADFRGVAGLDPLAANGKGVRPSRDFEYDGTAYLAQVAGVINASGTITRGDASFSVGPLAIASLVDKTQAMEILSTIWQVWIFAGAAFLLAIVAALILARGFLRPITQIEDGLLRIMNGDWTHRFEVKSAELGGLSYRINQLMAALLGDEEEGEAMEGAEAETDPREAYYQQLYLKFQDAQKQIKQDPASVSYADFRARLMENERKILDKNPGKQVDFDILVQGNQITFKPILK
jgi:HAMP domain-containing protein